MGPTWVLTAPDGPYVGPINLAIRAPTPICHVDTSRAATRTATPSTGGVTTTALHGFPTEFPWVLVIPINWFRSDDVIQIDRWSLKKYRGISYKIASLASLHPPAIAIS